MVIVFKKIAIFIVSILLSLSANFGITPSLAFAPKDAENVQLTFATVADTHLTGSRTRESLVKAAVMDAETSERKLDMFVLDGDNTNHGELNQYESLARVFDGRDPAENIYIVRGNHDTWTSGSNGEKDPPLADEYYFRFNEMITGKARDNVYYSDVINGYHIIVLASEGNSGDAATISEAQFQWYKAELENAGADGKPIFVFCHYSFAGTHGLPYTFSHDKGDTDEVGGLGDYNDRILEETAKYKNVFWISGHIHGGFTEPILEKLTGYTSYDNLNGINCINLPSLTKLQINGHLTLGTGYVFEVYPDTVVARARNFVTGTWLPWHDITIELEK